MRFDSASTRTMTATARRRRSPWTRLLSQVLALADGAATLVDHRERPWGSITFSGTRHAITLRFSGADTIEQGERVIAALPDHEFAIPGQLVADATIARVDHDMLPDPVMTVGIELLLLEDA